MVKGKKSGRKKKTAEPEWKKTVGDIAIEVGKAVAIAVTTVVTKVLTDKFADKDRR